MGEDRRFSGPLALGALVERLARPALKGIGRVEATLLLDWNEIVGPQWAAVSQPIKLRFPHPGSRSEGSLVLRVAPAFALLLQQGAAQMVERINAYLGFKAVERLVFRQGPLKTSAGGGGEAMGRPARMPQAPLHGEPELEARLAGFEEEALRHALLHLGLAIKAQVG